MTLQRLAPISLDELTQLASLQTRVDRKYLVDHDVARQLVRELEPDARILDMGGQRRFGYRSVYFDTAHLESFLGAARGRRRRFKVRIRTYLDHHDHFIEVKTRGQRGATVKERQSTMWADRLDPAGRAYVAEALSAGGIVTDVSSLRPTLTTEYRRSTLYSPQSGGRTTIDSHLRWITPHGAGFTQPGLAIIETKSAGSASQADRLLWTLGHRPRSVSKYATGLASLNPELPANKWRPVLSRHFTDTDHFTTVQENIS